MQLFGVTAGDIDQKVKFNIMMTKTVVSLDDDISYSDHFNGRTEATEYLRVERGDAAISVITRAEVPAGFDAVGAPQAKALPDLFPVLAITKEAADVAVVPRRGHRWKMPDAFQAAPAPRQSW